VRARGRRHAIASRLRALRIRPLVWLLILLGALLVSLYLVRFATIHNLRGDIARLEQRERRALVAQDELRDRLDGKDNPQTIEHLARELLGLVKPGEEKVIFIKGD
jgi:cell division protein FtsB